MRGKYSIHTEYHLLNMNSPYTVIQYLPVKKVSLSVISITLLSLQRSNFASSKTYLKTNNI